MARHPSIISLVLLFALFSGGACKGVGHTLGHVAMGVGQATAVAAHTLGPAMKVAAKVAVPVAKAAVPVARAMARVAHVGAKVAHHAAPIARDMGKLAGHVSVDVVNAGVMIGEVVAVDGPYDSGVYSFDVEPLQWQGESVELPPALPAEPISPTPPSFFELVDLYQEGLQSCFERPNSWASLYFFVELNGAIRSAEIVEGSLTTRARQCILRKTRLFRFPPDQTTHGLLVRVVGK